MRHQELIGRKHSPQYYFAYGELELSSLKFLAIVNLKKNWGLAVSPCLSHFSKWRNDRRTIIELENHIKNCGIKNYKFLNKVEAKKFLEINYPEKINLFENLVKEYGKIRY